MWVPLHQAASFEGVEQRGHAGTPHNQPFGDDVSRQRLVCALEDGQRLERACGQVCGFAGQRSIADTNTVAVRDKLAANSLAERLAPGNSALEVGRDTDRGLGGHAL